MIVAQNLIFAKNTGHNGLPRSTETADAPLVCHFRWHAPGLDPNLVYPVGQSFLRCAGSA